MVDVVRMQADILDPELVIRTGTGIVKFQTAVKMMKETFYK